MLHIFIASQPCSNRNFDSQDISFEQVGITIYGSLS